MMGSPQRRSRLWAAPVAACAVLAACGLWAVYGSDTPVFSTAAARSHLARIGIDAAAPLSPEAPLKVLVVCAHARGTPIPAPLAAAARRNHQAYAARHGYDYRYIGQAPQYFRALAPHFDGVSDGHVGRGKAVHHARAAPRYKAFAALEGFAAGYSVVFCLDADTLIIDMQRRLSLRPFRGGSADKVSLFFSGTAGFIIDSGALVLRRTPWAVDVLLSGLTQDSPRWGHCGDSDAAEWAAAVVREATAGAAEPGQCPTAAAPGCTEMQACVALRRTLPLHVRDHVRPLPPEELSSLPLPARATANSSAWGVGSEVETWPVLPLRNRLANAFVLHFPGALTDHMRVWARFLDEEGAFSFPAEGDTSQLSDAEVLKLLRDEVHRQPPLPGSVTRAGLLAWVVGAACAVALAGTAYAMHVALRMYASEWQPSRAWRQTERPASPPQGARGSGGEQLRSRSQRGCE
eukprot:TRINITY_DN12547_c0_g2_i1.p1 TRINITY_DN12547_c0_g2~~TRINITY_DN12547_c0_g2_i1.p1  ORF type:complete len:491 (+),score=117.49 TRINITY_DN12547_c0_g2_i1:88-1473(+)